VRVIPWDRLMLSTTFAGLNGFVKLGQPVPLSNSSMDEDSASPGHHIELVSWFFVVPVFVLKRSFCSVLRRVPVLLWPQLPHCRRIAGTLEIGSLHSMVQ
jgi:hypothetical protein